jgi:hypothetical protein
MLATQHYALFVNLLLVTHALPIYTSQTHSRPGIDSKSAYKVPCLRLLIKKRIPVVRGLPAAGWRLQVVIVVYSSLNVFCCCRIDFRDVLLGHWCTCASRALLVLDGVSIFSERYHGDSSSCYYDSAWMEAYRYSETEYILNRIKPVSLHLGNTASQVISWTREPNRLHHTSCRQPCGLKALGQACPTRRPWYTFLAP